MLNDLIRESPAPLVSDKFANRSYGKGDRMLICHVKSCNQVMKGHLIYGSESFTLSNHCVNFDPYRSCGS